jgi:radical SAM superfamily enzyme YgiQ (UPF0313 family)
MQILFIQPKLEIFSKDAPNAMNFIEADQFYYLHLSIYHLAEITPVKYSIKIIDERFKKINFNQDCDIVVITFSPSFTSRAYKIANIFKKKGKTVVMGGVYPTLMPEEVKQHADSVIIGESDENWPKLLKDFEDDEIKPFYRNKNPVDIYNSKQVRSNVTANFMVKRIETSRGCPNCCSFCLSPIILGSKQRLRSVDAVIKEIKSTKNKFINFDDSSMTNDVNHTKNLFKEMIKLNKKFFCCGNVKQLSEDDELLKLAYRAGCIAWFIGFESVQQKTLNFIDKKTNKIDYYKKAIEKIHKNHMAAIGSFMFGFDTDKKSVFNETLKAINDLEIDSVEFNILGIYPGTPLFDRLDKEGRMLIKDPSMYNFGKVVFQPKNMSPEKLEIGVWKIAMKFYSNKNLIKIFIRNLKLGLYPSFVILLKNLNSKKFYKSWKKLYQYYYSLK